MTKSNSTSQPRHQMEQKATQKQQENSNREQKELLFPKQMAIKLVQTYI